MSVEIGDRIGPYEILSPLGVGGMGEVFRAKDLRLDRSVALKLLPDRHSDDSEMRQRFEREARATATLSHPNVCALYDVGRDGDRSYLVMELLEGETLGARIARGPLPLDELLRVGAQIASALDAAHRLGIVHRDLKPQNVMLTRAGVKLLDFGLARLVNPALGGGSGASAAKTEQLGSNPLTTAGSILGTFEYMAPEQLDGREADPRSDVFGLGALLFEAATGRKAFGGPSRAAIVAAVLSKDPPPLRQLRPDAPSELDHLVAVCLAKNPDDRWQSAHDVARELEWIAGGSRPRGTVPLPARKPSAAGRRLPLAVGTVLAVAAGLLAGAYFRRPDRRGDGAAPRVAIPLPPGTTAGALLHASLAFSPDGTRIVFVGFKDGAKQLFERKLDSYDVTPLPGTLRGDAPFFSRDGEWIGFFSDGKLRKLSIRSRVTTPIADAPEARGGSFCPDGTIVFAPTPPSGLFRVSADGGTPERLTTPKGLENSHRWPEVLPDGSAVLFTIRENRIETFDDARLAVLRLSGKSPVPKLLSEKGSHPHFLPPDRIVFSRGGTAFAAPFDPRRLEITGPAERLVDGVAMNATSGAASLALSSGGSLAWLAGSAQIPEAELLFVAADGTTRSAGTARRRLTLGRLSSDGLRVALRIAAANDDLWLFDTRQGSLSRLTSMPGDETEPIFGPPGFVTFTGDHEGRKALFEVPADGAGSPQLLLAEPADLTAGCWTRDGSTLLYTERARGDGGNLRVFDAASRRSKPLVATPFGERDPVLSADGSLLAYVSDESGRDEVYLQPFPGLGSRARASKDGGTDPDFTPDGRTLVFRSGAGHRAVDVERSPTLTVSPPRPLFDAPFAPAYGFTPDGREVLMLRAPAAFPPATEIRLELHR